MHSVRNFWDLTRPALGKRLELHSTMLDSISRATLSSIAGTGSLLVWIFAQSPYVFYLF